jgi:hypothetical protein
VSTVTELQQFVLRVLGVKKMRGRVRVSVGVGIGLELNCKCIAIGKLL